MSGFTHKMASMTAVELGGDICALARTSVRAGEVELLAAETLDPAAFPGIDAFTSALKQARKSLKLPRRCRAVVWGLPDGSNRNDPAIKPLLAPLVGAGFRVERAISPCNALAALARLRMPRTDGATCWLAINRTGVAIVVVTPGKQLYSHSFGWDSNVGSLGSQARLLQRYSLVAFLAPEIRRAMAASHQNGARIDAIVTCGNLPEIRSLTMPLIEELDVEVETLDSLEGLKVKPDAVDRLGEVAASLRLACAGAIARPTRRPDESKRRDTGSRTSLVIAIAAAVLVAALVGAWWWLQQPARPAAKPAPQSSMRPPGRSPGQNPPVAPRPAGSTAAAAAPAAKPSTVNAAQPPASGQRMPESRSVSVAAAAKPVQPATQATPPAAAPRPPAKTTLAQASGSNGTPSAQTITPPKRVEGAPVQDAAIRIPVKATPTSTKPAPPAPALPRTATASPQTAGHPADTPDAARVRTLGARPGPTGPMPELLKDPVPRVTSILVSSDRRMATIDEGRIIGIGDVIGQRLVVDIDERAVVLREPSGAQIRVALGGKVVRVDRAER